MYGGGVSGPANPRSAQEPYGKPAPPRGHQRNHSTPGYYSNPPQAEPPQLYCPQPIYVDQSNQDDMWYPGNQMSYHDNQQDAGYHDNRLQYGLGNWPQDAAVGEVSTAVSRFPDVWNCSCSLMCDMDIPTTILCRFDSSTRGTETSQLTSPSPPRFSLLSVDRRNQQRRRRRRRRRRAVKTSRRSRTLWSRSRIHRSKCCRRRSRA